MRHFSWPAANCPAGETTRYMQRRCAPERKIILVVPRPGGERTARCRPAVATWRGGHPAATCPANCRRALGRAARCEPAVRYPMTTWPMTIWSAARLMSLPVTLGQIPAIALMHPMVGYPALVRMRVLPTTGDPLVPTTFPPPVATQPDISGGGRWTVFLDSDRRRGHHDGGAYVVPARRRRSDYASTESYCQHGNCYQLGCAKTRLSHVHSLRLMVAAIDLW
jgi:hypothetical protein